MSFATFKEPVGQTERYHQLSLPLVAFFCGYVVIWYLQIGDRITFLASIRFEFLYAATLSAIILLSASRQQTGLTPIPLRTYLVAYFIVLMIQIPFSYNVEHSWNVFIDRVVKFSFMAWFISFYVRSSRDMKLFLGAFLLACMKLGQEGFAGLMTGSLMWENQGIMRLHGPTPLYEHPNSFCGMALGTLPFIYYLFPSANKKEKAMLLLLLCFSLSIVLFSGSRTGYVGFFIFIIVLFSRSAGKGKFVVISLVLAMLAVPHIPGQYVGRFSTIFTGHDKEGNSIGKREQILLDSVNIFVEHPFGVGIQAFQTVRMQQFGRSQDTHNLYLEVATNLGIQGFLVFFLFVWQMLRLLIRIEKDFLAILNRLTSMKKKVVHQGGGSLDNDISLMIVDGRFLKAVTSAVICFIWLRLALGLFGMDLYEIYWWFALGITVALYRILYDYEKIVFDILKANNLENSWE